MFAQILAVVCLCGADEAPAKPKPGAQRFDLRRAAEWLFGKRAAPANSPEPKTALTEADLSDSRTEVRVRSAVFADPALRASGMTIRVVDGVVYLEGKTATRWQRLRAEQLARATPGCTRVENALQVSGDVPQSPLDQGHGSSLDDAATLGETVAVAAQSSPASTVVSRPKTLPKDESGLIVTTYAVRRTRTPSDLHATAGSESAAKTDAPAAKRNSGRLVPWADDGSESTAPLLNRFGSAMARPTPPVSRRPADAIDLAVQRALASSPFGDRLTFDRSGKDVILKGTAPTAALMQLAQEVSRIPGVGTVAIARGIPLGDANHRPSTSVIE